MSSYSYYGLYRAAGSDDDDDVVETPFEPSDDEDDLNSDGEEDSQTEEELANPASVAADIGSYYATTAGSLEGEDNICYGPSYADLDENISYGPADDPDEQVAKPLMKGKGNVCGTRAVAQAAEEAEGNISYGPDSGDEANVSYGPDSGDEGNVSYGPDSGENVSYGPDAGENVSYGPDDGENIAYGPSDGDEGGNASYGPADEEDNVCYGPSDDGEHITSQGPSADGEGKNAPTKGRHRAKLSGAQAEMEKLPSLSRGSQSKSKLRLVIGPGLKNKAKAKAEAPRKYPAPPTPAPADPSSIKQECHWNTQFQEALDMDEGKTKWEKLAHLARDFVYCSKTYGKIIISEYYLPEDEKTIKSIDAGGTCFFHSLV